MQATQAVTNDIAGLCHMKIGGEFDNVD